MLVHLPLVSPKAALFGGGLEESGTTLSVRRPFEPPPLLGSYWFGGWAWGVRNVPGRSPPLRAAALRVLPCRFSCSSFFDIPTEPKFGTRPIHPGSFLQHHLNHGSPGLPQAAHRQPTNNAAAAHTHADARHMVQEALMGFDITSWDACSRFFTLS